MSVQNEWSEFVENSDEMCYAEFYMDALKGIYDFKKPEMRKKVNESINKLRKIKRSEKQDAVLSEHMDYNLENDRCAYIYLYCILYSKMVSFHFKEFLEDNSIILKRISKMKNLRICCLEGGAAIEAVAIVKVISDLWSRKSSKAKESLNLEIVIVDKCSKWKTDSIKILKAMKEHPSLNITNEMNIHVDFVTGNVFQTFDNTLEMRIKKAHFVTMIKRANDFRQLFPEASSAKIRKTIKYIMDPMRVGGCFFVVDNGGGGIPTDVRSVFKDNPLWKNIYHPDSHVTHALENETVRIMAELLPGYSCSRETKVFSYIWIKKEPEYTKIKLKGNYSKEKFKK